jgi:Copper transport outer membrane protein, MctB
MINFRFHLVSLVAVFLALTVGIVVGATIVNHAIVTGLNSRIDTVEKNAETQRTQNRQLSTTAGQLESSLGIAAPYVVEGRLTAVPVVVVAEHGVDRGTVRNLVTLLQDAGARTPAIVWLESKWLLDRPADRAQLAQIMGAAPSSSGLRALALDALAHRLGTPVSSASSSLPAAVTSTSTTTTPQPADVLGALTTAGFVSIDPVGAGGTSDLSTFPSADVRAVVVGGRTSSLRADSAVEPMVAAFSGGGVPTIAGEVYRVAKGQPARGATLAPIRSDSRLWALVSTVDDVDLVQGQVAVVLAVADSGESKVGHFGYGQGADRALPPWSGP